MKNLFGAILTVFLFSAPVLAQRERAAWVLNFKETSDQPAPTTGRAVLYFRAGVGFKWTDSAGNSLVVSTKDDTRPWSQISGKPTTPQEMFGESLGANLAASVSGTPNGTKFLRDDWSWQPLPDSGTQAANRVLAGPATGSAATPTYRALVAADIPNLDAAKVNSGTVSMAVLPFLTASATLDFPLTTALTASVLTVSVPGAQVGDVVLVQPPQALISVNASFTGCVSSTGVVSVFYNNLLALSAFNPASGAFKVLVVRN